SVPGPRVPMRIKVHDIFYKPCRDETVTVTGDGGFFERAQTDDEGVLTIKAPSGLAHLVVRYAPKDRDLEYEVTATLVPRERKAEHPLLAHVRTFGAGRVAVPAPPALVKFQAARGQLPLTAVLDGPTKQAVDELFPGDLENGLGTNRG